MRAEERLRQVRLARGGLGGPARAPGELDLYSAPRGSLLSLGGGGAHFLAAFFCFFALLHVISRRTFAGAWSQNAPSS